MEPFSIIYADPPWEYSDKMDEGRRLKYPTMKPAQIKALPVAELAARDSVLFMWATFPNLPAALAVMEAWGFKYKTVGFVWIKLSSRVSWNGWLWICKALANIYDPPDLIDFLLTLCFVGQGHYTRANAEVCLIGTRGKGLKRLDAGVRQIIFAPRGEHSEKPQEARDRIARLYGDQRRLELFARAPAEGFAVWGNQVDSDPEVAEVFARVSEVRMPSGKLAHVLRPILEDQIKIVPLSRPILEEWERYSPQASTRRPSRGLTSQTEGGE